MNKLFGRISLGLGVMFLVILYFEYNLSQIPNNYSFKRSCFETQLDSIEVLILGNSKVFFGVDPRCFSKKAFNLANISQTLFYDEAITLKYLDGMPKLKVVMISISYNSFGEQLIDGVESWRDYFYYQFWDIKFPELPYFNIKMISKFYLYTPLTSVEYLLHGFKPSLIDDVVRSGYCRIDSLNNSKNLTPLIGFARVNVHNKDFKDPRISCIKASLCDFVAQLKKRGITPLFFTTPVHSTYYQYIDKVREKENIKILTEICSRYGCRYYNFIQDPRFVAVDFRDTDHLNFLGAKKFSLILNNEVLSQN